MKKQILLSVILLQTVTFFSQNWELKTTKNNIKVYVGDKSGSNYKQCKAVVDINTTIDKACKYLVTPDNYHTHSDRIEALKTIKKMETSAYYYLAVDLPWPLSNRDGLYHVKQVSKTATDAKVEINAEPTLMKEVKGFVRVKVSNTIYEMKKTATGITMTMYMHAEPEGSIPSNVANYFLIDSPLEIMSAIKKDLEK